MYRRYQYSLNIRVFECGAPLRLLDDPLYVLDLLSPISSFEFTNKSYYGLGQATRYLTYKYQCNILVCIRSTVLVLTSSSIFTLKVSLKVHRPVFESKVFHFPMICQVHIVLWRFDSSTYYYRNEYRYHMFVSRLSRYLATYGVPRIFFAFED